MRFIDWLGVLQEYPAGGLPLVCKELVTRQDMETGEISVSPNKKTHKGSHSSTISIRSDGSRVTIDGNPSCWNRADNLFGYQTFDECIHVYNTILAEFDLPPFTKCTRAWYLQGKENTKARKITDGAIIQRVDWTRNLAVGEGNVRPFLKALSSQSIGKGFMPHLYPNGDTLDWMNGSQRNKGKNKGSSLWYQKLYNKAGDLLLSLKKRGNNFTMEEKDYLEKLIEMCNDLGVMRDEKEFKRDFLTDKNLCFYGMVRETDFDIYLYEIDNMIRRLEVNTADYENISDQLIGQGVCKSRQAANTTQSYYLSWQNGQRMPKTSAYFVQRKRLLEIGIDISVPHDVTRLAPQIKRQREILVSTLLPPSWYDMPKVNHLQLVS